MSFVSEVKNPEAALELDSSLRLRMTFFLVFETASIQQFVIIKKI